LAVTLDDIAAEMWRIYEAEGKPIGWSAWLDAAKKYQPRALLLQRCVRFALEDSRMYGR
jgi:hypothetical protein